MLWKFKVDLFVTSKKIHKEYYESPTKECTFIEGDAYLASVVALNQRSTIVYISLLSIYLGS